MSLDLCVLMPNRISKPLLKSVNDFLLVRGFYKDKYCYVSEATNIEVYVTKKPEKEDYWDDEGLAEAVGFMPMTELVLESRHTLESHRASYILAMLLAKLVDGVIYDPQVAVMYDPDGKPYAHYRTDDMLEEYGGGIEQTPSTLSNTR